MQAKFVCEQCSVTISWSVRTRPTVEDVFTCTSYLVSVIGLLKSYTLNKQTKF